WDLSRPSGRGGLTLTADDRNRLVLAAAGRTFTLGPITRQTTSDGGAGGMRYEFVPEAGDEVSFTRSESWMSWPTWRIRIMSPSRTWRRHAYYRLRWVK